MTTMVDGPAADSQPPAGDGDISRPIHRQVEVNCSPERAFAVFVEAIHEWWPLPSHSVYGEQSVSVTFGRGVGEQIVEHSRTGETCAWGTILAYEPGRRLAFSWHPGLPLEETTDVEVLFRPAARGTLVELVHGGWERRSEPALKRAGYESGWIPVMTRFAGRAAAS